MKPVALRLGAYAFFGALIGLGGMTLQYAEVLSYISTDPSACVNCHIMRPQYDAWQKASHHAAATCADCHLPADFPAKYVVKARSGWSHSRAFTMQDFHEPIFITPKSLDILQANCLRCHADLLGAQSISHAEGAPRCVRCHDTVGHGDSVGLGGPGPSASESLNGAKKEE